MSFLPQSFGHSFAQGIVGHAVVPTTELKVGNYTVAVKERIAEGGFGFVDLVTEVITRKDFVLKRCNVDRAESMAVVKKEIYILQTLESPYVVKMVDSDIHQPYRGTQEALILLEFCPGGHLLDRLNRLNGQKLPMENTYRIFGQLLYAMQPFHENNPPITHRDLKLENILFGSDGKLRLVDFGSCVEGYVSMKSSEERAAAEEVIMRETTLMYRAPELVDLYMRDVLTEKSDIWALGCILFAMCFLVHPFQDAGNLGILGAKYSMPKTEEVPEDARELIRRMLDIDPEARPSIAQLIYFTSALASGQPLPAFTLTAEASRKREERIAANQIRENKQALKKKGSSSAYIVPKHKVAKPVDVNSVAARRLAAKRGQPLPPPSSSSFPAPSMVGGGSDSRWVIREGEGEDPAASGFKADFDSAPQSSAATTEFGGSSFSQHTALDAVVGGDSGVGGGVSSFDPFGNFGVKDGHQDFPTDTATFAASTVSFGGFDAFAGENNNSFDAESVSFSSPDAFNFGAASTTAAAEDNAGSFSSSAGNAAVFSEGDGPGEVGERGSSFEGETAVTVAGDVFKSNPTLNKVGFSAFNSPAPEFDPDADSSAFNSFSDTVPAPFPNGPGLFSDTPGDQWDRPHHHQQQDDGIADGEESDTFDPFGSTSHHQGAALAAFPEEGVGLIDNVEAKFDMFHDDSFTTVEPENSGASAGFKEMEPVTFDAFGSPAFGDSTPISPLESGPVVAFDAFSAPADDPFSNSTVSEKLTASENSAKSISSNTKNSSRIAPVPRKPPKRSSFSVPGDSGGSIGSGGGSSSGRISNTSKVSVKTQSSKGSGDSAGSGSHSTAERKDDLIEMVDSSSAEIDDRRRGGGGGGDLLGDLQDLQIGGELSSFQESDPFGSSSAAAVGGCGGRPLSKADSQSVLSLFDTQPHQQQQGGMMMMGSGVRPMSMGAVQYNPSPMCLMPPGHANHHHYHQQQQQQQQYMRFPGNISNTPANTPVKPMMGARGMSFMGGTPVRYGSPQSPFPSSSSPMPSGRMMPPPKPPKPSYAMGGGGLGGAAGGFPYGFGGGAGGTGTAADPFDSLGTFPRES